MTDGENSETAELRQQLAELLALNQILKDQHAVTTQRVDTLNQFVLRAAGASSVENVLVKGFETLSAQLEPLRDLTQTNAPERGRTQSPWRPAQVTESAGLERWTGIHGRRPRRAIAR